MGGHFKFGGMTPDRVDVLFVECGRTGCKTVEAMGLVGLRWIGSGPVDLAVLRIDADYLAGLSLVCG